MSVPCSGGTGELAQSDTGRGLGMQHADRLGPRFSGERVAGGGKTSGEWPGRGQEGKQGGC